MTQGAIEELFRGVHPRPLFLVESYWPGVSTQQVTRADARMELGSGQFLGSVLLGEDELLLRAFAGGSAELVAAANVQAGIPVERVVRIRAIPPARVSRDSGATASR